MLLFWNMCCAFQWNMRFDCFQITLSNVLFFDAQSLITLKSGGLPQLDSLWLYYLNNMYVDKTLYYNVFCCLQKQYICSYSFWRLRCKFKHFTQTTTCSTMTVVPLTGFALNLYGRLYRCTIPHKDLWIDQIEMWQFFFVVSQKLLSMVLVEPEWYYKSEAELLHNVFSGAQLTYLSVCKYTSVCLSVRLSVSVSLSVLLVSS